MLSLWIKKFAHFVSDWRDSWLIKFHDFFFHYHLMKFIIFFHGRFMKFAVIFWMIIWQNLHYLFVQLFDKVCDFFFSVTDWQIDCFFPLTKILVSFFSDQLSKLLGFTNLIYSIISFCVHHHSITFTYSYFVFNFILKSYLLMYLFYRWMLFSFNLKLLFQHYVGCTCIFFFFSLPIVFGFRLMYTTVILLNNVIFMLITKCY